MATTYAAMAVITARGGSKGIPRKNLRLIGGKPLLIHTIEQARLCRCIERIVVSTDDDEIAAVCKAANTEVVWRPPELAQDDTPTYPVLVHALQQVGASFDILVTLQPTSPLRLARHIEQAINCLTAEYDSVMSVCVVEHSPYKMFRIENTLLVPFIEGTKQGIPRQQLPQLYRENGAVYVTWVEKLLQSQSITGTRIYPYTMDAEYAIDIDAPLDLEIAEILMKKRSENER